MGTSTKVRTSSSRMRGHDSRPHKVRSHKARQPTNERTLSSTPSSLPDVLDESDSEEPRRTGTEYYNRPAKEYQADARLGMASDYNRRREMGSRMSITRDPNRIVREVRETHSSEHRRRRRKPQDSDGGGNESVVYVYKSIGTSMHKRDLTAAPRLRRTSDTVTRSRGDFERGRRDDTETIRISARSRKLPYPERQRTPLRTEERPMSHTASRRTRSYYPDRERTPTRTEERPPSRTAARSRNGVRINRWSYPPRQTVIDGANPRCPGAHLCVRLSLRQ